MCRYLAIPSNQDNITELLLLQVALHLSEGLFRVVNSLVEFLRATWIHVAVGWQGVAGSRQSVNHKRNSMLIRRGQLSRLHHRLLETPEVINASFPVPITTRTRWKNLTTFRGISRILSLVALKWFFCCCFFFWHRHRVTNFCILR